jgi:hypothetical protein
MERISTIIYEGKKILVIDYSGCKEEAMIELLEAALNYVLIANEKQRVLSIFNSKNYVTSRYVSHLESILPKIDHLIEKNVVVGISTIQQWILKGINLWSTNQIYSFDSRQEALEFLTNE